MGGRAPQVEAKADGHFFQLFPGTDDEPKAGGMPGQAAIPTEVPAGAPIAAAHNNPGAEVSALQFPPPPAAKVPIDAIELSDNQSGINNAGVGGEEEEVQLGGGGGANPGVNAGSIAERVMARRRANFAHFGDVL